jgi:hypothetical protein
MAGFGAIGTALERLDIRLRGVRSKRLSMLRDTWRARLEGKRVLLLGSAPGPVMPADYDVCVCVNGSPWSARTAGIPSIELTVVARYAIDLATPKSRQTLDSLKGLATREIVYIPLGQTEAQGRETFRGIHFAFDRLTLVSRRERALIIKAAIGSDLGSGDRDHRVSNGMFAAAIALWAGAGQIIISGFSMKGGHSYISGDTKRLHVQSDLEFLSRAMAMYNRTGEIVVTTSQEIHDAAGLPLVAARESGASLGSP